MSDNDSATSVDRLPSRTGRAMHFFVPGVPKPAGSKRAFVRGGKPIITDTSGQAGKDWRSDVKAFAIQAGAPKLDGPLRLKVVFYLPRPKLHYRSNGELKPQAPRWHTKRPDSTKLLRGLEDALTGILWGDDAQIAHQTVEKRYADHTVAGPGAAVAVEEMEP